VGAWLDIRNSNVSLNLAGIQFQWALGRRAP